MKDLILRPDLQIPLVLCGFLLYAGKANAVKTAVSLLGGNRKSGAGIHDDPPLIRIFRLDHKETLPLPSGEPDIPARRRHLFTGFQCILQSFYHAGMYPTTREALLELLEYRSCPEKIREIDSIYPDSGEVTMKRLGGDLIFGTEAAKGLEAQGEYADVYAFRYDFLIGKSVAEGGPGACHGSDVEIALNTHGTLLSSIFGEEAVQKADARREAMSRIMHGAWVDFCKTGNPNGQLPMEWIPYTKDRKNVFLFNEKCTLEENPKQEAYRLWEEIDYYAEPQKKGGYQGKMVGESEFEVILP